MENPRTGILILVLLAGISLAGGLLGWKLRQPAGAASGVGASGLAAADDLAQVLCEPIAFSSASAAQRFACYRDLPDDPGHAISLAAPRTASSPACSPLPAI